jgi:general secretion pathway protein F
MPVFDYKAVNGDAKSVEGEVSADSERAALAVLSQQGLTPLKLALRDEATFAVGGGSTRVGAKDLALVVKELATLTRAGIPLAEAINSIAQAHHASDVGRGFLEVKSRLNGGEPLSRALAASGLKFPPYLAQLTQAAEMAGTLPQALESASQQMLYEERIREETKSALIYPMVLVLAGIAAILFVFVQVVPKFAPILKNARAKVPELSVAVIQTGVFMRDHIAWIAAFAALLVAAAVLVARSAKAREWVMDRVVRVPLLGEWYVSTQIARWASVFGVLLQSRVPIVRAMELAEVTLELPALRARLNNALKNLRQGERLATVLAGTGMLKPTGLNLIRVGEQSGELGNMLKALADIENEAGQERKKRFLTLLEPACILVIGAVVAFVMYAVISALTSFNTIVR